MPDVHLHKEDLKTSLPAFLTAAAYGLCLFFPFSQGLLGHDLKVLLQIEFLVIHSFVFLALFAWMAGEGSRHRALAGKGGDPAAWRWAFWGMLSLYVLASLSVSWKGPLYFLAATAATYPVFLGIGSGAARSEGFHGTLRERSRLRLAPAGLGDWLRLGSIWLFSIVTYLSLIGLFDLSNSVDQWRAEPATYQAGLAYFLGLGLLEAFGAHGKIAEKALDMFKRTRPSA
jgi:hypothetical protein